VGSAAADAPVSASKPKSRVSFGLAPGSAAPLTRFPVALAPPNTPAAGLPLHTAMPVALETLAAPLALAAAATTPAAGDEDTLGFGDFVSGNLSAQKPSAHKEPRRSVKFSSSSALQLVAGDEATETTGDGPASERRRKPLRASWDQTPGHKEGMTRRVSKTPKAKTEKTPTTGGEPVASAAPSSRASSRPSSGAFSAAASSAACATARDANRAPLRHNACIFVR
jgi:hypothetical protein